MNGRLQRFFSRPRHTIPGGHTRTVRVPIGTATAEDLAGTVEITAAWKRQAIGEPAASAGVAEVRWAVLKLA